MLDSYGGLFFFASFLKTHTRLSQYHESMDNAEVLMAKMRLTTELQELVREYMKYRHRKQSMIAPER